MYKPIASILICLFLIAYLDLWSQDIKVTPVGNQYTFTLSPQLNPPIRPAGGTETPKWLYFWDFGDGHYSEKASPKHTYAKSGEYEISVYLTAAYSLDKQKQFTQKIQVTQSGTPEKNPTYPNLSTLNAIRLSTNNNELVIHDELQLVIHYRPPPGYKSGTIVLAFNEKVSRKKSFRFLSQKLYYEESKEEDIFEKDVINANGSYLDFLESQVNGFQSVYAYSYKNRPANSTARLFVKLKVETPRIGQEIAIKAFLIPDKGNLQPIGTITTKKMMILASHDPNRITVIPRTIELPLPGDTTFKYHVYFQNKGQGFANNINVSVDIPESLNTDSLEILTYRIANDTLKRCKDITREKESCFTYNIQGNTVNFQFKNVILSGTQGANTLDNQTTKGEIEFKIPLKVVQDEKNYTVPHAEDVLTQAAIKFDTEDDTIFTNRIDTRFRIRTWGVKAGFNAGRNLSELVSEPKGLSNLLFSVSFADNPVHQGLAWESELAYSSYRYSREKTQFYINEENPLVKDTLATSLSLSLFYADILAQSRYHFNDYFGIGFGGGFAALVAGRGNYEARLRNGNGEERVTEEIRNGLLFINQQYKEIEFPSGARFDPDIQNNPGSYLATIFFAEACVGKVNRGPAAGFRYGTRFQNGLFDVSFARQNFLQFFVQWKF